MNQNQLKNLLEDKAALQDLYHKETEVAQIKAEITRLVSDVKAQTEENLAERNQLHAMFEQYDVKYAAYLQLKERNQVLEAQSESLNSAVSKDKVLSLLNAKAHAAEDVAKATEKRFLKEDLAMKQFMNEYIE